MVDTFLKPRDPVTPVTPVIEVWLEKQIGQEVQKKFFDLGKQIWTNSQ
jgi:hypothetical protein